MPNIVNALDFINNQLKSEVVDLKNPNCSNCNECCSLLTILLPEEYTKLKKYLMKDKNGKKVYKEAVNRVRKHSKGDSLYFMCPFSTSNKKCAIYNIRPSICREFHCSKELAKDYDKWKYESIEHYTIFDLFK